MNPEAKLNRFNTALQLRNIEIRLGNKLLLAIDETVEPGQVLSIMGPSGSGKSSLLAYIGGFLDPAFSASGSVFLGETEITRLPPEERRTGLMFQDALLFPHMSVAQNLSFAIPASVRNHDERAKLVRNALMAAGLDLNGDRDPATLSGGQKSRVALLRVLLARPRALLLDEPFSKLDAELRQQIREFVFKEARTRSLPAVLVTHDMDDAIAAGGKTIRLDFEGQA